MQASHASAKGPQPDISAYHVLIIHFLFVQKDTKRAQQVLEVRRSSCCMLSDCNISSSVWLFELIKSGIRFSLLIIPASICRK